MYGGRWEQSRPGAATHLPFCAGHKWMHTARVGFFLIGGVFALPIFSFFQYNYYEIVNFFHFPKKTGRKHLKPEDKSVIISRSMCKQLHNAT